MVSRAAARTPTGSRDVADPTRWANTPSGMLRADSVPTTHRTGVGSDCVTNRASVVLPTPASPIRTMPQIPALSTSAEWIGAYSGSRRRMSQSWAMSDDLNTSAGNSGTEVIIFAIPTGWRGCFGGLGDVENPVCTDCGRRELRGHE